MRRKRKPPVGAGGSKNHSNGNGTEEIRVENDSSGKLESKHHRLTEGNGADAGAAREGCPAGPQALTCLDSHNDSENSIPTPDPFLENLGMNLPELVRTGEIELAEMRTSAARKRLFVLRENLFSFVDGVGADRVAFATVTPRRQITDSKAFSLWFKSMINGDTFKETFGDWWRVFEQHKSGAWHPHFLIDTGRDIRTGFNFDAWQAFKDHFSGRNGAERNRGKASSELARSCARDHEIRKVWAAMKRIQANSENVGVNMVEPVASTAEAVGRYLAKYLSKSLIIRKVNSEEAKSEYLKDRKGFIYRTEIDENVPEPPKVRLYGSSRGRNTNRTVWSGFAWNSPGRRQWRKNVQEFANALGVDEYGKLSDRLGPRWAYHYRELLRNWTGSPEDVRNAKMIASEEAFRKMCGV